MDALGLGYDKLSALNPRLIYASMTGFGPTGPYAHRPGYDVMASALGGLMHITGTPETPVKVRFKLMWAVAGCLL
jgi:succinate--hydroxymethylglutarate CoA-transferase